MSISNVHPLMVLVLVFYHDICKEYTRAETLSRYIHCAQQDSIPPCTDSYKPVRTISINLRFNVTDLLVRLVHGVWIEIGCVGGDAILVPVSVMGYRAPPKWLRWVFDVLGHGELSQGQLISKRRKEITYVMIVLLHRYNPWHVVKGHGTQPEVCIVWNFADLPDEAVKVRRRNAIYGGDEIRRSEAILIGWGAATLQEVSATTTLELSSTMLNIPSR